MRGNGQERMHGNNGTGIGCGKGNGLMERKKGSGIKRVSWNGKMFNKTGKESCGGEVPHFLDRECEYPPFQPQIPGHPGIRNYRQRHPFFPSRVPGQTSTPHSQPTPLGVGTHGYPPHEGKTTQCAMWSPFPRSQSAIPVS
jgi:hypothetical protein